MTVAQARALLISMAAAMMFVSSLQAQPEAGETPASAASSRRAVECALSPQQAAVVDDSAAFVTVSAGA